MKYSWQDNWIEVTDHYDITWEGSHASTIVHALRNKVWGLHDCDRSLEFQRLMSDFILPVLTLKHQVSITGMPLKKHRFICAEKIYRMEKNNI